MMLNMTDNKLKHPCPHAPFWKSIWFMGKGLMYAVTRTTLIAHHFSSQMFAHEIGEHSSLVHEVVSEPPLTLHILFSLAQDLYRLHLIV